MTPIKKRTISQIVANLPPRGWIVIAGPSSVGRVWDLAEKIADASPAPERRPYPPTGNLSTYELLEVDAQCENDDACAHLMCGFGESLSVHDQRRAPGVLMRAYPNMRFIVPTQNPFLCQAASPGGLIVCPADAEPYIADERLYNRVTTGSVDDVLIALYGLDHTWSDAANEKRQRLAALEAKLLTGKASPDDRAEFDLLCNALSFSMSEEVDQATVRYLAARGRRKR